MSESPIMRLKLDPRNNIGRGLNQDIGVLLLERQHGPETHGASTGSTNVDTEALGLLDELVALGVVERDERSLTLATEVGELAWVLLAQRRQLAVQVVTHAGSLGDQVVLLDLLDDGTEQDSPGWVTHPCVELPVWLVGPQLRVAVVVACRLRLLGKGHHVGRRGKVPVVVGPELASRTDTSLHLVHNQENSVLLGELTEATEELGRGMVVTTLGLDGLDDDSTRGQVPGLDEVLDLGKRVLLGLAVLLNMLLERVLEQGEGGLGPIKSGNVELVDRLGAGGGKGAKQTAVEGGPEGQDGQLRSTRGLVVHRRGQFLLSELNVVATTLLLSLPHESRLVSRLVGVRAGHGGEHLVEALGGHLEDTRSQDFGPVVGREVAQGGPVDQRSSGVEDLVKVGDLLLGLGARNLRLDGRSARLDAVEETHLAGGN
ncbi:hypothetical protein VP1G_11164 [Cytospora mali]|uniref:Uncharacterized protein n=1 Tax=Cytospora mali TaxID=578113 RepID=A0A194V831_CYTMA|nr:hypothetical protein VP1G_11164 [Valsa mali var. pyri (nom. inval.)]